MRRKHWIGFLTIFTTLIYTSTATSTDDLAEGFFAHLNDVKDGVFPRRNVTEQSLTAISQAAKMFEKVMNGQIAIDDPIVAEIENLRKVLFEKLEETKRSITGNRGFDLSYRNQKSFMDIEMKSEHFAEDLIGKFGLLRYNQSADRLDTYKDYCLYRNSNADTLISGISGLLTFSCPGQMFEEDKLRFAKLLADFPHKQFLIKTQSALAFFAAADEHVSINDIISRFMNSYKRLETYRISEELRQERAVREIGTREEYEPFCFLDAIYYHNLCDKKKLVDAIAAMEKIFYQITIGNTVCSAIRNDGEDRNLKFIDERLNEFREDMNNYYYDAMANSFQLCEPTQIRKLIEQFSTGPVDAKDYQKLGDHILKEVNLFGRPELRRHVVVTSDALADTNYYYAGPVNRTSVIRDTVRKVTVFYTYHEVSANKTLMEQLVFLPLDQDKVDKVIENHYRSESIDEIVNQLSAKNISLTSAAPNRYSSELWIRDFSYTGDCSVKDSISFEGNTSAHHLLTYKWRNDKNPFKACEAYKIYLFP